MDNFSDENEEKNIAPSSDAPKEGSDIEFDESIDIDELQKTLLEQIKKEDDNLASGENPESQAPVSENPQAEAPKTDAEGGSPNIIPQIPKDIKDLPALHKTSEPQSKKYVVYIEAENVPFMEKLSIHDRKLVINKILKEQDRRVKKEKQIEEKKRYTTHVIIAVLTFILAIPLMFYIINKSVTLTMINYKLSKQNFEKLYRAHGRIQPKIPILPRTPKI